jgi:hypothetical protein
MALLTRSALHLRVARCHPFLPEALGRQTVYEVMSSLPTVRAHRRLDDQKLSN